MTYEKSKEQSKSANFTQNIEKTADIQTRIIKEPIWLQIAKLSKCNQLNRRSYFKTFSFSQSLLKSSQNRKINNGTITKGRITEV